MNVQFLKWLAIGLLIVVLAGTVSVAQQQQAPGVSATEIKIGGFIAQSGPVASIGIPVAHGAQAWYNWVNDTQGGILGRKITFIVCDDGFVPANSVACYKELTEKDNVFAIAHPLGTAGIAAVFQDMVKSGIPVVSPHANATFLSIPTQPNIFAIQPNNVTFATVLAHYAIQDLGATKIGIVYSNDAYGTELHDAFVATLKANGLDPVVALAHAPTETDYSAIALQLKQAGPQVVALLDYEQPSAAVIQQTANIGFQPRWMGMNTVTDPSFFKLLSDPTLANGLIAPGFAVDPSLDTPEANQFRAILQKYYPNDVPGGFSEIAYVGAQLITDALLRAGPNLTWDSFINALNATANWTDTLTPGGTGLTPPITYTPTDHRGIQSLWIIEAQNGGFVFVKAVQG